MSTPDPAQHGAWAGPSGLRVERLDPAAARPAPAAAVAVEPGPAGEPLWFTAAQWADLCAACAELGPGFAPEPAPPPAADPATALTRPATAAEPAP